MVLSNCFRPICAARASIDSPSTDSTTSASQSREECCHLHADVGVLSQPDGSAYLESGSTKVMCAVYGPYPASTAHEAYRYSNDCQMACDLFFLDEATSAPGDSLGRGSFRASSQNKASESERDMAIMLQHAIQPAVLLESFPKCVVKVHTLVLQADGGELAAAICCASLALADAGIPMIGLVAACSMCTIPSGNCEGRGFIQVLDPSASEEGKSQGSMVLATLTRNIPAPIRNADDKGDETASEPSIVNHVTQWQQSGTFSGAMVMDALELCHRGCRQLHAELNNCLLMIANRSNKSLGSVEP